MGLEIETEVEESDLVNDFEILEVEGRYHFGIDGQDDRLLKENVTMLMRLSLRSIKLVLFLSGLFGCIGGQAGVLSSMMMKSKLREFLILLSL